MPESTEQQFKASPDELRVIEWHNAQADRHSALARNELSCGAHASQEFVREHYAHGAYHRMSAESIAGGKHRA
jgi:hypothetical protein